MFSFPGDTATGSQQEARPIYHLIIAIVTISSRPEIYTSQTLNLNELSESAVQRRAERLNVLVEVNSELSTLSNALRSEFEFLPAQLAFNLSRIHNGDVPCKPPCTGQKHRTC